MKKLLLSLLILGLVAIADVPSFRPVPALADSGATNYRYLVATDFLCGLDPFACPAISSAENGDTIEVTGSGTLGIHPKSVSGGGTFTHKSAAGDIVASGSWVARQLISFHSYGSGAAQGTPPEFEGGLALMRVQLWVSGTAVAEAVMQVDCALGKPPASAIDGVRLAVQGGPNFNKEVIKDTVPPTGGFTVFIRE